MSVREGGRKLGREMERDREISGVDNKNNEIKQCNGKLLEAQCTFKRTHRGVFTVAVAFLPMQRSVNLTENLSNIIDHLCVTV